MATITDRLASLEAAVASLTGGTVVTAGGGDPIEASQEVQQNSRLATLEARSTTQTGQIATLTTSQAATAAALATETTARSAGDAASADAVNALSLVVDGIQPQLDALDARITAMEGGTTPVIANAGLATVSSAAFAPSLGAAVTYSATILAEPGLVAYWRLGEASGNPQDSKGTNHVTVVGGSPTYGVTGALYGDSNKAVTFNGSTGYFSAPDADPLDLGDGPLSIECWGKRSTSGTWDIMVAKSGGAYSMGLNSSDHFFLGKTGTGALYAETATVTDTDWHHYVATKNGATTVLYRDGYSVAMTGSDATLVNTATALEIGTYVSGGDYFAGSIDEVALYNVVLTPTQVLNHYAIGMTGSGGGGSGASVTVYSLAAMMAAIENTATTEVILANGTYSFSSYLDISGSTSGFVRTSASAVVVRAETDGGVTFDGGGVRILALWFRNGCAYQEWRGFKFANFVPWDNGIIGFGQGNGVPVHHVTLRNIEFLSSCVTGAGPVGSYRNGHSIYFQEAASGGNHDILIDGFTSNANTAAQVHVYHDNLSGPGTGIVIRNCTWTLAHRSHAISGLISWSSTLGTVLMEDVTISGANEYAIDHNYNGTWTLRRVTTTDSTQGGFHSTQGTYPTVTGFTFDTCSFA